MPVRAEHAGQLAALALGPIQAAGDEMARIAFQVDLLDRVAVAIDLAVDDGVGRRLGRAWATGRWPPECDGAPARPARPTAPWSWLGVNGKVAVQVHELAQPLVLGQLSLGQHARQRRPATCDGDEQQHEQRRAARAAHDESNSESIMVDSQGRRRRGGSADAADIISVPVQRITIARRFPAVGGPIFAENPRASRPPAFDCRRRRLRMQTTQEVIYRRCQSRAGQPAQKPAHRARHRGPRHQRRLQQAAGDLPYGGPSSRASWSTERCSRGAHRDRVRSVLASGASAIGLRFVARGQACRGGIRASLCTASPAS